MRASSASRNAPVLERALVIGALISPLASAGSITVVAAQPVPRVLVVAQAGSTGGSLAKEGKSASGDNAEQRRHHDNRKAQHDSLPNAEQRRHHDTRKAQHNSLPPRASETRIASPATFDGTWSVATAPRPGSCGFPTAMTLTVSNGTVDGTFVRGRVDPSGRVNVVWMNRARGIGRLLARVGSGVWRSQDCTGSWTAARRQ
jgi:hypothetical protein